MSSEYILIIRKLCILGRGEMHWSWFVYLVLLFFLILFWHRVSCVSQANCCVAEAGFKFVMPLPDLPGARIAGIYCHTQL